MGRLMAVVLVMMVACTGVVFAQEHAGCPGMMGHMRMMGSMMPMNMNMIATDAWDGMLYVLTPMKLEKLGPDLTVVKSVEYEKMACMAPEGEQAGQQFPLGGETMQMMHRMHKRCMMSSLSVTADARGVYVTRGMMVTVYDHDLNEQSSKQLMMMTDDPGQCPMCKMMMEGMEREGMMSPGMMGAGGTCPMMRGGRMGGGMAMGGGMMGEDGMDWSVPREQRLDRGVVQLSQMPARLKPGMAGFKVMVLNETRGADSSAFVTATIVPWGSATDGMEIDFARAAGGSFTGEAELTEPGRYDLALSIQRSYRANAVVHFDVWVRR